jgi:tetratricopeptide (TPR) repeat protein
MTTKAPRTSSNRVQKWQEVDDLYHKLLYWYYDRENLKEARRIARQLEGKLSAATFDRQTILHEGAWSLVLECKGDLLGAIKHREKEIRLIKRLLQISLKSLNPNAILKYYDYSDLSDRLDLLAILYHDTGNLEQARKILRQSKRLCVTHQIPFDGQDLLDDFMAEQNGTSQKTHRNSQKKAV